MRAFIVRIGSLSQMPPIEVRSEKISINTQIDHMHKSIKMHTYFYVVRPLSTKEEFLTSLTLLDYFLIGVRVMIPIA